jgi:hypothetical protein
MDFVNVTESERDEQARKFISDYGGWNISTPGWSNETWKFLPNLIKIHRNLKISPLFFTHVLEDIKNSTRYQILVSFNWRAPPRCSILFCFICKKNTLSDVVVIRSSGFASQFLQTAQLIRASRLNCRSQRPYEAEKKFFLFFF